MKLKASQKSLLDIKSNHSNVTDLGSDTNTLLDEVKLDVLAGALVIGKDANGGYYWKGNMPIADSIAIMEKVKQRLLEMMN